MSWNATRYTRTTMPVIDVCTGHVRGLADELRKADEEVSNWRAALEFITSLDAVERDKERQGKGVAWCSGWHKVPEYPSGEGMTIHAATPVVRRRVNKRGVGYCE